MRRQMVPLGKAAWATRRVSSGMAKSGWGWSDTGGTRGQGQSGGVSGSVLGQGLSHCRCQEQRTARTLWAAKAARDVEANLCKKRTTASPTASASTAETVRACPPSLRKSPRSALDPLITARQEGRWNSPPVSLLGLPRVGQQGALFEGALGQVGTEGQSRSHRVGHGLNRRVIRRRSRGRRRSSPAPRRFDAIR